MPQVVLKHNIKEFTKHLTKVQRKQIPFATSRAINDTAKAAQGMVVSHIQREFNNRKVWWKERQPTGIKIKRSRKTDLTASVYSNAYFLPLQEEGGIKTPKRGRRLAIPTGKGAKKFHKAGGAREFLESNPRAFSTPKGIFRRRGKKRVEAIFTYSPTAQVSPALEFEKTCRKAVNRHFKRNFTKRLSEALRTAR